MPMASGDRDDLDSRILALQNLVDENEFIDCELIFMASLNERRRKILKASLSGDENYFRVENLMSGRSENYAGDLKLVSDELVTIQIHHVSPHTDGRSAFPSALAVAIHWPSSLRQGVIWEIDGQR
jgi:hypothetical protein